MSNLARKIIKIFKNGRWKIRPVYLCVYAWLISLSTSQELLLRGGGGDSRSLVASPQTLQGHKSPSQIRRLRNCDLMRRSLLMGGL